MMGHRGVIPDAGIEVFKDRSHVVVETTTFVCRERFLDDSVLISFKSRTWTPMGGFLQDTGFKDTGSYHTMAFAQHSAPVLYGGSEEFIWMRVSWPVYTARPMTKPLFFRVHPRSSSSLLLTATVY